MRTLIWIVWFSLIMWFILAVFAEIAHAGTTMHNLSKSIQYVQLDKIEEQRKEALEASQKALSKDDIARLKDKADEVKRNADKASSPLEFYDWILNELERNVDQPNLFYLDMALVSEQVKRFGEDPEFFSKHDRNDLRLAVKVKDYYKARKIVQEAQARMHPGATVICTSEEMK